MTYKNTDILEENMYEHLSRELIDAYNIIRNTKDILFIRHEFGKCKTLLKNCIRLNLNLTSYNLRQ